MKKFCLMFWLIIFISSVYSQFNTKTSKATVTDGIKINLSSPTDYFRTIQSGVWNDLNIWESSPDNITWGPATLTPDFQANTITIRDPDSVYLISSITVDQVLIYGGAVLNHVAGVLIVQDGAGADIDDNGIFMLSLASNGPQFSGSNPTINIATGGILRVSAAGLTGAGSGVNASNYVYNNNSVLEYTLTGAFSTNNVVYFPNVNSTTIPIFRVTANSPITINVGSNNPTTFNGLFQISGTATVRWQNSGDKIFRNGIDNTGNMDFEAASIGSAKFIINGTTARIGGTGSLLVPTTGGLEIGPGTTVTMISNKTVTGNITLLNTNSIIDLGIYNLTVSGTISISQVSSFIRTTSTGVLTLQSIGAFPFGSKLFPIGNSSINPLFISSAPSANFSARIVEPITPPIYKNRSAVLRTWYITSSATSTVTNLIFGYTYPSDCGISYVNTGPNAEIGFNISNTWNIHQSGLTPAAFSYPNTYIVSPSAFNSFSAGIEIPFVVSNLGAILSSDFFISCNGQTHNGNAMINWRIGEPGNINNFEVQRSIYGRSYQTISSVFPVSNQTDYGYIDASLPKGASLYRIKVNSKNNGVRYSNVVAIINNSTGILITSISPNPVRNNADIVLTSVKPTSTSFCIYDISGRSVKEWRSNIREGINYIPVDLSKLPSGIYHLIVSTLDERSALKFIKN